jgi:adenosylmethionine-8-amino-7-oxononanoate aminotransferase
LGAVLATKKVVDAIASGSGTLLHGFTYNAHPIAMATGRAVLERVKAGQLVAAADSRVEGTTGASLGSALRGLQALRNVGDVRGIGMLWGVEFVADKASKRPSPAEVNFAGQVGQAGARRGLMLYPMQGCVDGTLGDHVLIAPPAVITAEQIAWAVEQLSAAIEEAAQA